MGIGVGAKPVPDPGNAGNKNHLAPDRQLKGTAGDIGSLMGRSLPETSTSPARPIRVLCVNFGLAQDSDRPTLATFTGLRRAGIDITVVCSPQHRHYAALAAEGVSTVDIPLRSDFDRLAIRQLRAELVRGDYHIVHTFNNKAISNVLRAAKGLPVKIVAYRGIVGAAGFLEPSSWLRYLNPRIDRIVCVAEAVRQHFLTMRPAFLRMPAERPVTIHKGHGLEWYTDAPVDLTTLGIPAGAFVIACVANYRPRKGIEFLVDAIDRLPDEVSAHLLLVGHMEAARLRRRIARSPARARIHLAGYRIDAPRISAAADVVCLPSTKREGLPRSIVEAMAYRVPAIVTNSGGSPELVVDGECGIVVPVHDSQAIADAIERLYRDPALRRRMGEAARERIGTHFRIEDTVRKTVALYEELVGDRP
jgi:glycosyltransferase involved in cell wall biosynthesis